MLEECFWGDRLSVLGEAGGALPVEESGGGRVLVKLVL